MKNISKVISIALFLFIISYNNNLFGQVSIPKIELGDKGLYAKNVDFTQLFDKSPDFIQGRLTLYIDSVNFVNQKTIRLLSQELDDLGYSHYKWQQTINNIPVENAIFIQHVKNKKLTSQHGYWVRDTIKYANQISTVSQSTAIAIAKKFIGAKKYQWEVQEEEQLLKQITKNSNATYLPSPALVYYSGEGVVNPAKLRLSYKIEIYANTPFSRRIVFVDAITGEILGSRDLVQSNDVTAIAQTAYSGTQTITTNMQGNNQYRLREAGRGKGIFTLNMSGKGSSFTNASDFTNSSTNWNISGLDKYALDAHWGQETTYDFYKNIFNRNSIDNAGYALYGYVHTDIKLLGYGNHTNAFWDGTKMVYGDGDYGVTPLTALDIVGHVITHGLTQNTAALAYNHESGALNESFSDMMGTAIEFYGKPTSANWTIGENTGLTFRSMSNPKLYSQPDTYGGVNWKDASSGCVVNNTSNNDNCWVHNNSGVGNHWFYLLAVGGSGTNDLGNSFVVQGIGINKAQAIAFRTLTLHLTPTSNYTDCRTQSITSATELYGVNSLEVNAVINAWYAVGIGSSITNPYIAGQQYICSANIYSIANLPQNANVSWSIPSSAGPVLQLASNTPSVNQLTVTNQHYYGISTTLTATITKGNTVSTLTLPIANDNSTSIGGNYVQDACTCYNVSHPRQTGIVSTGTPTFIHACCDTRVTLNLPANKTIVLEPGSGTPTYWSYSGGILYFALPYLSGGIPFTFDIVPKTNDGSCSSSILFFAYGNNGNAFFYNVAPNPISNVLTIWVIDNGDLTVNNGQNSNMDVLISKDNKIIKKTDFQFTAKIYDIKTNRLVLNQKSNKGEMFGNFNVSTLASGTYFVQIIDSYQTQEIRFIKN